MEVKDFLNDVGGCCVACNEPTHNEYDYMCLSIPDEIEIPIHELCNSFLDFRKVLKEIMKRVEKDLGGEFKEILRKGLKSYGEMLRCRKGSKKTIKNLARINKISRTLLEKDRYFWKTTNYSEQQLDEMKKVREKLLNKILKIKIKNSNL